MTEKSVRAPESASGKGPAGRADKEDISNAVAGEYTVISQSTRVLAGEAESKVKRELMYLES